MNRLARERSPYLLQHAHNPVDWYAWNDEAFERARRDDKPIFLSIGYSTCHWCHVMEHESFESAEIAALLNRDFVSIKVDREERPDVDRVYMTFVQATTGQGGWPMTVFLRPDLKPFYGGTYFPPTSRWGKPGFADLVKEIARVWREERSKVNEAATELTERLKQVAGGGPSESEVAQPSALESAVAQFQGAYDLRLGGFGKAPKFPRPSELLFLLREYARTGSQSPLSMATGTLKSMAVGGMRDHIGGGFHRYSVDEQWRVPHFEKMLYDQAQLVVAYLEAGQATGDPFYASIAEDTLQYVLRDMTSPEGGFYSAEDADSVPADQASAEKPHKREGAFYVWSHDEVGRVLGLDAEVARRRYGIEPGGNAPEDPQGEFSGQNILYIAQPLSDIAVRSGMSEPEILEALVRVRQGLFEARERRPRPHLDDKILTAWNGLMIAALARAARVLPDSPQRGEYEKAATAAASFIRKALWQDAPSTAFGEGASTALGAGRLLRRYRDGEAAIEGYAEDYAYLNWGLLELFQATGDAGWLRWAIELQKTQDELFWDATDGGWFSTTGNDPSVLLRLKEDYDGAEPAAGSVSALNCLTFAHLLGDHSYRQKAERTLARYGPRVGAAGRVIPMMLSALSQLHSTSTQVVVVGGRNAEPVRELERELAGHYLPFAVQVPVDPDAGQDELKAVLPFIDGMKAHGGGAVYVCTDFTCQQPVSSRDALRAELQ
jgi:uncharacterized protein YyaL (SSP411 family)